MKKKLISYALGVSIICVMLPQNVMAANELNIYVSPNGLADADGSIDKPYATLEEARDKLRATAKSGYDKINVVLRGGSYILEEGFKLSSLDSGSEAVPIVYTEYPGEEAIITGATKLDPKKFIPVTNEEILNKIPEEAWGKYIKQT